MSRLTEQLQTHIIISGKEYPLNMSYKNALKSWDALKAANDGDLSPLAASIIAVKFMLNLDCRNMETQEINEALKKIAEYLDKYARISDKESKLNNKPLIDLEQDGQMIYDAFQAMGIDLDTQEISYPRFMSLLREIPKEASICRIIHLRQQHQRGKLTKEEKEEIKRRGSEVVFLRDRKKEKEAEDNKSYFRELQNKKRAKRGLPPV